MSEKDTTAKVETPAAPAVKPPKPGKHLVLTATLVWSVGPLQERVAYRGALLSDVPTADVDALIKAGDIALYDPANDEQKALIAKARKRAGLSEGGDA